MIANVKFPDDMDPEVIDRHVRNLESLLADTTQNAVVVAVPKDWNEVQRELFSKLLVELRDEISDLEPVS